jgi:hypothetical protein
MYPWRLIAILEEADPSFKDVFYPHSLRCWLDKRTVSAIEEHWPAYFPTRKECRGSSWSLHIPANKPLYKPHPKTKQELNEWKQRIEGTIAEIRAHGADISWRRFDILCRKNPRLRPLVKDFKPLADWLISEESMWRTNGGGPVREEEYSQRQMQTLLAPGSPYHFADRSRLRFLHSGKHPREKIRLVQLMRTLFDRPLMILAALQKCACESKHSPFWLPIQKHIDAIIKAPSPLTFRKTWLEHAMLVSGAIKKNGRSCPRKWARKLVGENDPYLIGIKAIEVNSWLKGNKRPSLKNVRRAGEVIFSPGDANPLQNEIDLWIFSWMITLWLEKHFTEVAAELDNDSRKIQLYYRRFFRYLKIDPVARNGNGAGGH